MLVQSCLAAMPYYLMQTLCIPDTIIDRLKVIMNQFLWQGCTEKGVRWCGWDKICRPFEEGSLNIRKMEDMQEAFLFKTWFRLRRGNTLWAAFMLRKYCAASPIQIVRELQGDSAKWKYLLRIRDKVEEKLHWQLGKGDISFWRDSWLPNGKLQIQGRIHDERKVSDFWSNGTWDLNLLQNKGIPRAAVDEICQLQIFEDHENSLLWKGPSSCFFSTTAAWNDIRERETLAPPSNLLWHSSFPKKVAFFTWRSLHGWVSSDEIIKRKGLHLASQCYCGCKVEENIHHIFISSTVAREV